MSSSSPLYSTLSLCFFLFILSSREDSKKKICNVALVNFNLMTYDRPVEICEVKFCKGILSGREEEEIEEGRE